MKICWDNIEGLVLDSCKGVWFKNTHTYRYEDSCMECNEPFLTQVLNKGKYCSMSCARKNRPKPTKDHIKALVERNKQRVWTPEMRDKMSRKKKGICYFDEEQRLAISLRTSGANNPNWQGGKKKEPYCQDWDRCLKDYILDRDGYSCMNKDCWGTSSNLYVHHIDYDKKNCTPYNLVTLCCSCNSRANYDREYWKGYYRLELLVKEIRSAKT